MKNFVWLYVWKACRNHNEEHPSNSDYVLVNIESWHSLEDYEAMEDKSKAWDNFSEDWAENVDSDGYYHGYSYGWSFKTPPKEFIEKKIKREKDRIKSIRGNIKIYEKYL